MRYLVVLAVAVVLLGQEAAQPALEPIARGARDVCGRRGCDEVGRLRIPVADASARVIARRDPEYMGTPFRSWRLVIETASGAWAVHEPLGEDATVCTDTEHITWHFALRALEARDVLGDPTQEIVVLFHDGRNLGVASFALVCSVEGAAPRCTVPIAVDGTLDTIFVQRGSANGVGGEVPLVLR